MKPLLSLRRAMMKGEKVKLLCNRQMHEQFNASTLQQTHTPKNDTKQMFSIFWSSLNPQSSSSRVFVSEHVVQEIRSGVCAPKCSWRNLAEKEKRWTLAKTIFWLEKFRAADLRTQQEFIKRYRLLAWQDKIWGKSKNNFISAALILFSIKKSPYAVFVCRRRHISYLNPFISNNQKSCLENSRNTRCVQEVQWPIAKTLRGDAW